MTLLNGDDPNLYDTKNRESGAKGFGLSLRDSGWRWVRSTLLCRWQPFGTVRKGEDMAVPVAKLRNLSVLSDM